MTPDAIINLPCHTAIEQLIEKWRDDCPKDQPSLSDFNDGKMVAYSLCITDLSILLAALPAAPDPDAERWRKLMNCVASDSSAVRS